MALARQTKHYEWSCRYIARHRNTIYKDIPIDKLVALGCCAKRSHLAVIEPNELVDRVPQVYDTSYLYNDWKIFC